MREEGAASAVDEVGRLLEVPAAPLEDAGFNRTALAVFAEQYTGNSAFRAYCDRIGRTPSAVAHWNEIPALPTDAFKQSTVALFPPEDAVRVFMTSGTSRGPESRGKIYKDAAALALHDRAACAAFERYCLPDRTQIRILVLAPPPDRVPNLRMAHDCALFRERYGTEGSAHMVGEQGLDLERLIESLRRAEAAGEPVLIVGASFTFVVLFDAMRSRGEQFSLPAGSRTVDGGGYKGRSRELTKQEFIDTAGEVFGVRPDHVVNLLGITELTSLYIDNVLADAVAGRVRPRFKPHTPWTRTVAVHPETLEPIPRGEVGLLRHFDLANARICPALQSEDLGYETDEGFEVLGRAQGAELRGCSLAMEQFLEAVG
jgi:acyl-CoA synthetase (AMP-forming)/AMP-acid ligase II